MSAISDHLDEAAERIEKAVEDADLKKINSAWLTHTAERLRELAEEYRGTPAVSAVKRP